MNSSFNSFRLAKHEQCMEENIVSLRHSLIAAKPHIEAFELSDCTVKNCRRALAAAGVGKHSLSQLASRGLLADITDTRGRYIDQLCADDVKCRSLAIPSIKQSTDEKAQIEYVNENRSDFQLKKMPNGQKNSRAFITEKVDQLPEELDVILAMNRVKECMSPGIERNRALRSARLAHIALIQKVNRTRTVIGAPTGKERFNRSSTFDAVVLDPHNQDEVIGYAIMKYQKGVSGGSQQRQKDDVHNSIRMGADYIRTNPGSSLKFYIILDGGGMTKKFLDEVNRHIDQLGVGTRIFSCTNDPYAHVQNDSA